ncbi:MAG: hypothetical protein U9O94_02185 [Nanoarchaeota archaeon]|nr:hypothetical protein [Nanoarchaeota archaeon]
MKTRLVKDKTLKRGRPASSKFLTADELKKVYPERNEKRSADYMFDPGMALAIPEKEAFALVKKYPELIIYSDKNVAVDTKDEWDELGWDEFKHKAALYGVKVTHRKRVDITSDLRQKIADGAVPIDPEERTEKLRLKNLAAAQKSLKNKEKENQE